MLHQMRQWDVLTANRVDYFQLAKHAASGATTAAQQQIYPPVNIERFLLTSKQDFYLTVSVSYKRHL